MRFNNGIILSWLNITGSGTCSASSSKSVTAALPITYTTVGRDSNSIIVGGDNYGRVKRVLTKLNTLSTVTLQINIDVGGSYDFAGIHASCVIIGY